MRSYFCLSVTFLDRVYHGRGVGSEPEWPPSPLRLFQALVAAAKARWRGVEWSNPLASAFHWLEQQPPPLIVAPSTKVGQSFRLSVPNNDLDMIARSWAKGQESRKQTSELRTMKTVQARHLLDGETIHYLWAVPDADQGVVAEHLAMLSVTARDLVALGWGIDLAAGLGRVLPQGDVDRLSGERWQPTSASDGVRARLPVRGTLQELAARHQCFLSRVSSEGEFNPVPPLHAFREVVYRRDNEPVSRPFAAFQILTPDASRFRAFSSRWAIAVAGMTRHAAAGAGRAAGRPESWVNEYLLGHGPSGPAKGAPDARRFAYLPLPSIDPRGVVGAIRRILVAEQPGGTGEQAAWVRRNLCGRDLTKNDSNEPEAVLSLTPATDSVIRHYVRQSAVWSTVTPVVLPGYDDGNANKATRLLRKSMVQAGFPVGVAQHAELDLRPVGFRPGLGLATEYQSPAYLKCFPKWHVQIRWRDGTGQPIKVRGPVVIGAGRYCGLGLFAAVE
jgi:CRISPR-associated protein Csb2